MGSKKKAFAVIIPALALVTSACQVTPGGAAGPQPGQSTPAAGSDLDGGQLDDVKNPGDPDGGQQPGDGQQSPGDGQQPPADGEQPPADGEQPPADGEQPPADGEQPPGDGEQPPADGEQPPADGEQPPADGEQPPADGEQPPGDDQQVEIPELREDQYVPIRQAPRVRQPRTTRRGSKGVFRVDCGTNEGQAHNNPDNVVAAPGVVNGAHHIHDYVGNLDTDAFSTDETLAAAGTTCTNGDKSTYFWPVLRLRDGEDDSDRAEQSRIDGNVGSIVEPAEVKLEFLGNPRSRVVAMPQFIRMATGDAKAVTNGLQNAKAQWTCTGFENRAFTDKYPLCPEGSLVTRVLNFASCWDGQNTDSANHRDHIAFPDERTGACPEGTLAVPQLRMTLTYDVPAQPLAFALDSFPESGHDPVTDHGDFINVMGEQLMQQVVNTVNGRKRMRGGQGQGNGQGQGQPTEQPAAPTEEPAAPTEEPAVPTEEPADPSQEPAPSTEEPATRNQQY
ncbi:DUF1996 domain-containing protein [Actinomadura sp. 7K534]|uniref:DUF1996 domain-containing protein n=1 Tax=Actinomadura sp. 7K534 TaxID=2530366 RepID=UPI001045AA74|nr:DUF1996 domain-containing protein [Actinomadura sp. 7K534]TDB93688.1 DUF1996 domain-containing protein [Actinomadura sp. 7K534]